MNKKIILIIIIVLLFLIFFGWIIFKREKKTVGDVDKVINVFFTAETLYLKAKRQITYADGKKAEPNQIEVWIKNGKIREDIYNKGEKVYTYLSQDDDKVIAYNFKKKTKEISPADKKYYLSGFQKPAIGSIKIGEDEKNRCSLYDYQIDTILAAPGSTYSYYLKNRIYCVNDYRMVYFKNYGGGLVDGKKPTSFEEDRFEIQTIKLNIPIDSAVFKNPF
ncbi:MAG: hypothetical protein N2482_01055 [Patescibacteria group bacterium]|nr:hypothetical protein [Patescibacteria group bacterium]